MPGPIAIFGPTGKLGLLITNAILKASPTAIIHAYARTPSKLPAHLNPNPRVKIFQGDSDNVPAIRAAMRGCKTVICAYLGDMDFMFAAQKTLIDACEEEGVPRYIASDWSIDYRPLKVGDLPPKDPTIKIERYIREEKKTVKGVHVLVGAFMEMVPRFKQDGQMRVFGSGDEKLDFSTYATTAEWTAQVALDEEAVGVLKFREVEISMNEIADKLESIQGERPKTISMGSNEEFVPKMEYVRQNGPLDMTTFPMFYMYWMNSGKVSLGRDEDLDNGKYPEVKIIDLNSWLAENMK